MTTPPRLLIDRLGEVIDLGRVPPEDNPRQRMPAFVAAIQSITSPEVALRVWCCVVPQRYRDDDEQHGQLADALGEALELDTGRKAPSRQQVAQKIAIGLGLSEYEHGERGLVTIGSGLLDLAAAAGLVEIRREHIKFEPARVYPTAEALAQADDATYRILMSKARLPDEPVPDAPVEPVAPGRNRLGRITPQEALSDGVAQALDLIRATPWRVNQTVLHARAETSTAAQWKYTKAQWDQLCAGVRDEAKRSRLKQVDRLIALAVAAKQGESTFYLDVTLDYRGRIYHPGPLRFTGADHVIQPLLEFANGEKLTGSGAKHLAIYLGSLQGIKDFDAAEAWTRENSDKIIRVARDSTKKRKLWWSLKERKRWHFLAAADAWRRYDEGEAVHFPCSWDATTSGLQVLALLMRDKGLGSRAGLTDGSEGTFYQDVAVAAGEDRGAAKAICVPWFYGAGEDQSVRDLTAYLLDEELPVVNVRDRARNIRAAAAEIAAPFVDLRAWLARVAVVFNDKGKAIRWRTPTGYEVVLDNRHPILKEKVRVRVGNRRKQMTLTEPGPALDQQKQATSLPAAIVHSLDASLLMTMVRHGSASNLNPDGTWPHLSAQKLELPDGFKLRPLEEMTAAEISAMQAAMMKASDRRRRSQPIRSWGVVHDCFAVHPNDVERLRYDVFQSAVLDVFGPDWLADLYEQFREQAGPAIPEPPGQRGPIPMDLLMGRKQITP